MNPFSSRHPANPRDFVNRADILESYIETVNKSIEAIPPRPGNIAILGGWGMGKTSMLNKFESLVMRDLNEFPIFSARIELTP